MFSIQGKMAHSIRKRSRKMACLISPIKVKTVSSLVFTLNWSSLTSCSVFSGMLLMVAVISSYCWQMLGRKGICRAFSDKRHVNQICRWELESYYPWFSARFSSIWNVTSVFLRLSARLHRSLFSLPAFRQNMDRGIEVCSKAISLHMTLNGSMFWETDTKNESENHSKLKKKSFRLKGKIPQ